MTKKTIKKLFAGAMVAGIMALFVLPLAVNTVSAQEDIWGELQTNMAAEGNDASLADIIAGIIRVIMGVLGVIVVLIILWGGFIWMTAGGVPDKVDKAKKMIYSGIIGLIVILAAYAIASFVMSSLTSIVQG
ncbi:MAG: hypothetical protein BWY53_00136 [Parcubacteria group bacterium ADurb.Bin326]|nr:MAG: hypothetical protein BWY53_00136 [Parcubacteria group bacterium ADurb.Bin326]